MISLPFTFSGLAMLETKCTMCDHNTSGDWLAIHSKGPIWAIKMQHAFIINVTYILSFVAMHVLRAYKKKFQFTAIAFHKEKCFFREKFSFEKVIHVFCYITVRRMFFLSKISKPYFQNLLLMSQPQSA